MAENFTSKRLIWLEGVFGALPVAIVWIVFSGLSLAYMIVDSFNNDETPIWMLMILLGGIGVSTLYSMFKSLTREKIGPSSRRTAIGLLLGVVALILAVGNGTLGFALIDLYVYCAGTIVGIHWFILCRKRAPSNKALNADP